MQFWQVEHLFVKKKVLNLSELHFSEVASYKIHTLGLMRLLVSQLQTNLKVLSPIWLDNSAHTL